MERLSFIDQVLHKVGTSGLPELNMQGAMVIDPAKSPYEVTPQLLAEHIASRLCGFSILRKKLVQDRLKIGDIRMIDDADFNALDHIAFATLPAPGNKQQLDHQLASFSAEHMNLERPLWKFLIIDGLDDGKLAVMQKISHATMDGMAAFKVMQAIFDKEPTPLSRYQHKQWDTEPEPSGMELLKDALKENVHRYAVDTPQVLTGLSKRLAGSVSLKAFKHRRQCKASKVAKDGGERAKARHTSLNGAISRDNRSLGFANFELDKLKVVSKALDCKLNDLCLLMVSEALKTYFKGIGEKVDFDLIFVMPISTRATADKEHGNALALSMINVHNTIRSLPERLRAITVDTQKAKNNQSNKQQSTDKLPDVTAMLSPLLIDIFALALKKVDLWDKLPSPINLNMSNVPGPPWSFNFAGMPIEYQIPIIPVFHKGALSVGATSMGNMFSFGFHACGDIVKEENMHFLIDGLTRAYQELAEYSVQLASTQAAEAKATAKPKAKTSKAKTSKAKAPAKKKAAVKKTATKTKPKTVVEASAVAQTTAAEAEQPAKPE